ncbi:hypothetical protein EYX94_17695 [Escherichia coli]|nr:hypothetical protein EYX95_17830 [Escherichia coli]TIJ99707.1 hypothetical protein EYX94_17695 [Escherichia coli]
MNWLRHTYQETLFPGRTYPPETPLLSGLKFFGIYRTQKNADITDRLLSVPNSADLSWPPEIPDSRCILK